MDRQALTGLLADRRATFCAASPGTDGEISYWLSGFDASSEIASVNIDAAARIAQIAIEACEDGHPVSAKEVAQAILRALIAQPTPIEGEK